MKINKPNFLIIGAMKAATTSLYTYLKQHPDIFMPIVKEPMFFNNIIKKNTEKNKRRIKRRIKIKSIEEYYSLFKKVRSEKAIGEASPAYIYHKECAELINTTLNDVKIIAVLRQPVKRAYSNFLHARSSGKEPISDFISAFNAEEKRIKNNWTSLYHYKSKGYYFKQLKRYYDIFPRKNIKIILFEDLIHNPNKILKDLFTFLEVDNSFVVNTERKANVSGTPKGILGWIIMKMKYYQITPNIELNKMLPISILKIIEKTIYSKPKKLKKETVNRLTNLYYKEDISKLETLTNKDLTMWLN